MYVIIVYDIEVERITKVRTILRRYLFWIQNSVFEGAIEETSLKQLLGEIKQVIKTDHDSIVIYRFKSERSFKRSIIGVEPPEREFIL